MSTLKLCMYRLTTCDSGSTFNPFMHVFIFSTFVFGLFMVIGDSSVAQTVLYMQTPEYGSQALNLWGVGAMLASISHVLGLALRGRIGLQLMRCAMYLGFFVWLWAAIIYLSGGFLFQFLIGAFPELVFWSWYAWQWRKRHHAVGDPNVKAFVN